MSAWQDIFSLESWEILTGVRAVTNREQKEVYIQAKMPVGKGADICAEYINEITKLLTQYHDIPKTDIKLFVTRINLLQQIELLTEKYINARGDEFQHKKGKKLNSVYAAKSVPQIISATPVGEPIPKSSSTSTVRSPRRTAHHVDESKSRIIPDGVRRKSVADLLDFENAGLGSMDQWIESLHKRAKKKTAHLEKLAQSPLVQINKDMLMTMATVKHQDGKLYPGVILEKLDMYHRESEFDPEKVHDDNFISDRPMDKAYNEWVKSGSSSTTPFFLWLEQHSITTSHKVIDKKYEQINVVEYDLKHALVVEIKNCNLMSNEKNSMDDDLDEFTSASSSDEDQKENSDHYVLMAQKQCPIENEQSCEFPLNTAATITGEFSNCNKIFFKMGSTAYIWDINDENKFITHPHLAKKYHHSSLVKGENVRCSGMWLVENGQIKYIDNASGHYRCSPMRFFKLVKHLEQKGLVNEKTEICEVTKKDEKGTMKLNQYYQWVMSYISDLKKLKQDDQLTEDEMFAIKNMSSNRF